MKKRFAAFLLTIVCLLGILPVQAEEETPETTEETEETSETAEETEEEKKQTGPDVSAQGMILIEAESGQVLAGKNTDTRLDPAGLAKIMGVYIACEELKEDQKITMSSEAFTTYDHSSSVIWVMEGETLPALDLEYASIVQNANDTTAMLAEAVSGDQDTFLARMNSTAEELGMANTKFTNIFGLYDQDQYTTAEDMAILTRKALKNSTFAKVFAAPSYVISSTSMQVNDRVLAANCEMIRDGSEYDEDATGCKLGYTSDGGYALAVSAERNGLKLIVILLGETTEEACYDDARTLFDYGFANYKNIVITPEMIGTKTIEIYEGDKHTADVTFSVDKNFSALLSSSIDEEDLKAEIVIMNESTNNPNLMSAEVIFTLQGTEVGSAEMTKTVQTLDTVSTGETGKLTVRQVFNYACIAILGVVLFAYWARIMTPPSR